VSVKAALLALLADGSRYGYQLKAEFDAATGSAWPLNVGQVYSTLQRLERDELVEADGEPDDDGRQPYRLTRAGKHVVDEWFATPIDTPSAGRDEVSIKMLMAIATGVAANEVLRQQRVAAMSHLQALTAQKATTSRANLATRLQIDRNVLLAEAQIRWLDLIEQRLESADSE